MELRSAGLIKDQGFSEAICIHQVDAIVLVGVLCFRVKYSSILGRVRLCSITAPEDSIGRRIFDIIVQIAVTGDPGQWQGSSGRTPEVFSYAAESGRLRLVLDGKPVANEITICIETASIGTVGRDLAKMLLNINCWPSTTEPRSLVSPSLYNQPFGYWGCRTESMPS